MDVAPIRTRSDHRAALERIEALMELDPRAGTPEGDALDVLATLVEAYEERNFPIDDPDPIEAITFQMDQLGLSRADLEPLIGGRGRVSEILNRKRALSIGMIRRLSPALGIPAELLIRQYRLDT
jgi:HTH-type transcriptional regulator/antitoxin HigA